MDALVRAQNEGHAVSKIERRFLQDRGQRCIRGQPQGEIGSDEADMVGAAGDLVGLLADAGIAEAMGARGIKVDAPDQVGDALRDAVACGRPTVLELMVTQELGDPFRRDALSKPVRFLDKYKDYV